MEERYLLCACLPPVGKPVGRILFFTTEGTKILHREHRGYPVVAAKNYGRKMPPASFNYVACLPVGRYWLWGKTREDGNVEMP